MKKLTAKALSLLTSVRLQRQQVKSTIATLIFTFLLLQCTTYKKQVDADAGQGTIETEQKDVASGQTRQKTMAQKGRRVNLPLLPDSLTKDIYITDSMQALYDDEEWVMGKLNEQVAQNPFNVKIFKLDTVIPIIQKVLPGVDLYSYTSDYGIHKTPPILEYRGYRYSLKSINVLYVLIERNEPVTVEDRINCMMHLQYFEESLSIESISEIDFTYENKEYNHIVTGTRLLHRSDGYTYKGPFKEYIQIVNNQFSLSKPFYNNSFGPALGFWDQQPNIELIFKIYNIKKFYNLK